MSYRLEGVTTLLEVFDMPTSIRFYRDVLGFEVVMSSGEGDDVGWALLRRDDASLMLNSAYESNGERPLQPVLARQAAHRDTILYFGCRDVDAVYEDLRGRVIDLAPPEVQTYGMKQLYLHDPDGYGICFQWSSR